MPKRRKTKVNRKKPIPLAGALLVFEGPDGVGKTTLAERIQSVVASQGVPCVSLAFPGKLPGSLGSHVYRLHHNPERFDIGRLNPVSLQLLHVAAHVDALQEQILPALAAGKCVVLDRYWWSTWVYGLVAGGDRGVLEQIKALQMKTWDGVLPAAVFLVARKKPFRQEQTVARWQKLTGEYRDISRREAKRHPVCVVPNESSIEDALRRIAGFLGIEENAPSEGIPRAVDTSKNPHVFSRLSPAKPTVVFDTYWRFAVERQAVFFKKVRAEPPPWTRDPIIATYKFTNAYRASDRVSQYLIRNVIYSGDPSAEETFFRIILFKVFNRIDTWERLEASLGKVRWADYSFKRYDGVLSRLMAAKHRIFSPAYIMPPCTKMSNGRRKHRGYLRLIEQLMKDEAPRRISEMKSMRGVFEYLLSYPSLGEFLAYQYSIDINYSPLTNFSEMEFVAPGPGARSGIGKCFSDFGGLTPSDLIRVITNRQEEEFANRGLTFDSLWGRKLHLVDCQNLFCEVDKYARMAHPEIQGHSTRKKIKQKYRPAPTSIDYRYPPKWGLNERIAAGKGCKIPNGPS